MKYAYIRSFQSAPPPQGSRTVRAFTLAEVLITLGIIGVVAALTLPALITNTQNKQLEAGLKKAYSTLSQTLKMYEQENGYPATPSSIGRQELKPILMKYLNTVRDCGTGSTGDVESACIPNNAYVTNPDDKKEIYKTYNGNNNIEMAAFDDGQFIINDGMLVLIENSGSATRVYISVDVNGYNKKPNRLGQDLFMFQINNDGHLLPMGAEGTDRYGETYCSTASNSTMNGASCTAKALHDKDFFKSLPR